MVISFEMQRTEKRRFIRAADRLLVTIYTSDEASSGLGNSEKSAHSVSVWIVR